MTFCSGQKIESPFLFLTNTNFVQLKQFCLAMSLYVILLLVWHHCHFFRSGIICQIHFEDCHYLTNYVNNILQDKTNFTCYRGDMITLFVFYAHNSKKDVRTEKSSHLRYVISSRHFSHWSAGHIMSYQLPPGTRGVTPVVASMTSMTEPSPQSTRWVGLLGQTVTCCCWAETGSPANQTNFMGKTVLLA